MSECTLKKKLAWQCRRGMLELDVVLIPFLENHFDELSASQQADFEKLLQQADPDIYSWLMGYVVCTDACLQEIIQIIQQKNVAKPSDL